MIYILSFEMSLFKATLAISTSFSLMILLFEIPSGIFADLYGRKRTLNLGCFLLLIGVLLFSFGSSFWIFLLGGIFWGIGIAFDSGASDAFLYDTLLESKRENEFKKIKGDILFYTYIAFAVSSLIASFLYVINPRLPFYLSSFFVFISFIMSLTLREPKYHKSKNGFYNHFKESFAIVFKNNEILWIAFYSIVFLESIFIFNKVFSQPYLIKSGIGVLYFGVLFALFRVFSSIGSKFSHKLENYFDIRNSLLILMILLCLSFLGLGLYTRLYGFLFIFIIYFILGASRPIIDDYYNKRVKSSVRATVVSIIILFAAIFNMVLASLLAYVSDITSLNTSFYLIFGVVALVIIGLFFRRK